MVWEDGPWGTYTCRMGAFTIRLQQESGTLNWKADINGMTLKARWDDLLKAKVGAVEASRKIFLKASQA